MSTFLSFNNSFFRLFVLTSICVYLVKCDYFVTPRKPYYPTEPYEWLIQYKPKDENFCERAIILYHNLEEKAKRNTLWTFKIVLLKGEHLTRAYENKLLDSRKKPAEYYKIIIEQIESDQKHAKLSYLKISKCLFEASKYSTEEKKRVDEILNDEDRLKKRNQMQNLINLKASFLSNHESTDVFAESLDDEIKNLLIKLLGSEKKLDYKLIRSNPPDGASNVVALSSNPSQRISSFSKNHDSKDRLFFEIVERSKNYSDLPLIINYIVSNAPRNAKKYSALRCYLYVVLSQNNYNTLKEKRDDMPSVLRFPLLPISKILNTLTRDKLENFLEAFKNIPPTLNEQYVDIVSCMNKFKPKSNPIKEFMEKIVSEGLFNDIIDPRVNRPEYLKNQQLEY